MPKSVISVEHLTKKYDLGVISTGTLTRDLERWWARVRKQPDPYTQIGKRDGFAQLGESILALDDVSFAVEQGETLGIIGRNGAGKSTLLKILSRVTAPTSGVVKVKGRIGSLLEVGTGFHPELTGRENVYLNGAILGMKKAEVTRKFDEIVAFSGVEKFIDTPVKRYSSGMYVRLAFAVAAHLDPEILIVDEVLAVGDAEFQKKCLGKMGEVAGEGRTVLFVSHNMGSILTLCANGIVLKNGSIQFIGNSRDSVTVYSKALKDANEHWKSEEITNCPLQIKEVSIQLKGSQPELSLYADILLQSNSPHKPAFLALDFSNSFGTVMMQAIPKLEPFIKPDKKLHLYEVNVTLPPLIPGRYFMTVWVGSHNTETLNEIRDCVSYEIDSPPTRNRTFPYHSNHGFIVPMSKIHSKEV